MVRSRNVSCGAKTGETEPSSAVDILHGPALLYGLAAHIRLAASPGAVRVNCPYAFVYLGQKLGETDLSTRPNE